MNEHPTLAEIEDLALNLYKRSGIPFAEAAELASLKLSAAYAARQAQALPHDQ